MARWLKLLVGIVGVAGLALATLPWWLGAVLRPVLGGYGVGYDRYERIGYARFRLVEARYAKPSFELTAQQIESATPLLWLMQRLRGAEPVLTAHGWTFARRADAAPAPAQKKVVAGLPDLEALLNRIAPRLGYWLPHAQLDAGEVRGLGPAIPIARVLWQNSTLMVDGVGLPHSPSPVSGTLTRQSDGSLALSAQTAEKAARLQVVLAGAQLTGEGVVWEQPLHLSARFPAQGWVPAEANAVAENWRVPAARVKLGAPYAEVQGNAHVDWRDGAFDFAFEAQAMPGVGDNTKAPPFAASAKGQGTLRELTLTTLEVNAPFATAHLTAPVSFGVDRPLAAQSAELTLQGDLAKLPWLDARGTVDGTIRVAGETAAARQDFELSCHDVSIRGFSVKAGQAHGTFAWPRLEFTSLSVQLDETSSATARGAVNWKSHTLEDVALSAKLGFAWFVRWVPARASWSGAEISATAAGPWTALQHQGTLQADQARWSPLHPLALNASWRGRGAECEVSVRADGEDTRSEIVAQVQRTGMNLTRLQITSRDEPPWQLAAPWRITWSPTLRFGAFELAAPERRLALNQQPDGAVALTVRNFGAAQVRDWLTLAGPDWMVDQLEASGRVVDGALAFRAELGGQIDMKPRAAQVKLVAHGEGKGVELQELKVQDGERVLTEATGKLPVAWRTEPKPHLAVDETGAMQLNASTQPDSPLWATLAAVTGLQLNVPHARVTLSGTPLRPEGKIELGVVRLSADQKRLAFPLPDLEQLALTAHFDREKISVSTLAGKVDGQPIEASGQVPMTDARWDQLWHNAAQFDWSEATARLELAEADAAAFARRWPMLPLAQGKLSAHVELARGHRFSGTLGLSDAVTHPLPVVGTLRDVQAELALTGRTVAIRSVTAMVGSEPLTLEGNVGLVPGKLPRLDLALKGKNLPLVRNTGLLLRSDVDLRAKTDDAGVTGLSGSAVVRDCLVLANINLKSLLPGGRRGVTRQPPFFRVEAEPFRRWPLAVEIRAPNSIRVRTTAYRGVASAGFRLGGTLGEPRAVGELTVDRGQILFPFATFAVEQGSVRLREADLFTRP